MIHFEPRSPVIESSDVQSEPAPILTPSIKSQESTIVKRPIAELHGTDVNLPNVESAQPGPFSKISMTTHKKTAKVKKSTGGLCASCLGGKAAEKQKNETISESVQPPIEQKKTIEQEKEDEVSLTKPEIASTIRSLPISSTTNNEPILPKVNIDVFKERDFQNNFQVKQCQFERRKHHLFSFFRVYRNQVLT